MRKVSRNNENAKIVSETTTVKSKYFSIDSYFKSPSSSSSTPTTNNTNTSNSRKRKISALFDQRDVEKAIELSLKEQQQNGTLATTTGELETSEVEIATIGKKEQCPFCVKYIFIESESLQVHVNKCLDSIQEKEVEKENEPPTSSSSSSSQIEADHTTTATTWKEKFACKSTTAIDTTVNEVTTTTSEDKKRFFDENNSSVDPVNKNKEKEEEKPRRVLPSTWKDMFSSSSATTIITTTPLEMKNVNTSLKTTTSIPNSKPNNKTCPFYKRVKDTRFVVDAFNYGKIIDCDGYFLSHYHSDHFGGLRANWTHGLIYCSQITANLVKQELHVNPKYVHALPMNQVYPIPRSNVEVVLIDANHCPGSVLILFIIKDKNNRRHLHTGDFRAQPKMCLNPFLKQPENPPIHTCYLDTTYMNPQYAFPAQEECIQAVCDVVKVELGLVEGEKKKKGVLDNWFTTVKKPPTATTAPKEEKGLMTTAANNAFQLLMNKSSPKQKKHVLIVVGTYTIGKEKVFIGIARLLNCKIYAPQKKKKILLCQQDPELESFLTNDPLEAQVHIVSLRDIKADMMYGYLGMYKTHFSSLLAFKPTGWTYKSTQGEKQDMTLAPLSHIIQPPKDRTLKLTPYYNKNNVKLFGVPYSEHSSFRELGSFIASLDILNIVPTVNINQVEKMKCDYFDKWNQEKLSKRIEVVAYPNQDHW